VQEGLEKYEAGNFHDARLIFRRAMKIDPGCEAPYFYMAESYVKDRRELDAVEWWVKFAEAAPEKAWLVFNPLQKVLFNIGNFGKIEDFYLNILKNRQNDVRTITALANYYERKGDLQKASNLVEDLIENNPNSTIAKIAYCKLLVSLKRGKEVGDVLNDIIDQFDSVDQVRCSNCGHQVRDILWICPMCGAEDSFLN
jgi:lipopolysaccharide biosynthesis regulator YciM